MCGRFSLGVDTDALVHELDVAVVAAEVRPRWNIAPTQDIAAIVRGPEGLRLGMLRWGLVPPGEPAPTTGARFINARSESVHRKPTFRDAFRRRRCLIPADGFYEWRRTPAGTIAYHIRRPDGRPFTMAGIWDRWQGPAGETVVSCAILTTAATDLLRPIHDRMPVILDSPARARWLDPEAGQDELLALLASADGPLQAVPVSSRVNSVAHDDAECARPLPDDGNITIPLV